MTMSVISTTRATQRLTRKLQKAGINQWVAKTSGDKYGNYLRFIVGGKCVGGCGWTLSQAEAVVDHLIEYKDCEEMPPLPY